MKIITLWLMLGFSFSLLAEEKLDPNRDYIVEHSHLFMVTNWQERLNRMEQTINQATPPMEDYQTSPLGKESERLSTKLLNLKSVGKSLMSQITSDAEKIKVTGKYMDRQNTFAHEIAQLEREVASFAKSASIQKKARELLQP